MSPARTLEIARLGDWHPRLHLLGDYALAAVFRLSGESLDGIEAGLRVVDLEWGRWREPGTAESIAISWQELAPELDDLFRFSNNTCPEAHVTEFAAIVVAALLVFDLFGLSIHTVLQIGSGGDYWIQADANDESVQLEVSGIVEDPHGYLTTQRIKQKVEQVRGHAGIYFVSVTAFRYGKEGRVYTSLQLIDPKGKFQSRRERGLG